MFQNCCHGKQQLCAAARLSYFQEWVVTCWGHHQLNLIHCYNFNLGRKQSFEAAPHAVYLTVWSFISQTQLSYICFNYQRDGICLKLNTWCHSYPLVSVYTFVTHLTTKTYYSSCDGDWHAAIQIIKNKRRRSLKVSLNRDDFNVIISNGPLLKCWC